MHEAKTRLSQLVEHALAGEEVVITRRGRPRCGWSRCARARASRHLRAGEVHLADDFELPDELADALGAR